MPRLPSPDDEFYNEDAADSRLIWGIRKRDSNQIAAAIMAGAPFGHTAKELLAWHFDEDAETPWTLKFQKRGRGRPPSEAHRQRQGRIWQEIDATAPLVKDEDLHIVLAPGQFEGFIEQVRENLAKKHGMEVTASEVKKLWVEYADDNSIKRSKGGEAKGGGST
ncbi:MAG: hypothetical protein U1E25_01090 [Methylocystis sp.]